MTRPEPSSYSYLLRLPFGISTSATGCVGGVCFICSRTVACRARVRGARIPRTGETRRGGGSYSEIRVAESLDLARLLELARWLDPQISADAEHSTRLGVALALADAAGLDGRNVALATIGGLLHDVGKVAVPMPILAKARGRSTTSSSTRSSGTRLRAARW